MIEDEDGMSFLDGFLEKDTSGEAAEFEEGFEEKQGEEISDAVKQEIKMAVISAIKEIYDPEIPVNIYELGLIYEVGVDNFANVNVIMTLTTPNCPVAESMPAEVEIKTGMVDRVNRAEVNLTFEPPWDMSMMSEAARLEMGLM